MYLALKEPGSPNTVGDPTPLGEYVGLGVKVSNTQLDMEQGPLENTGRTLDVAIQGNGFFRVKLPAGVSDGFGYTRNGAFNTNSNGDLVVAIGDGYRVDPPITIPPNATNISIGTDGVISYKSPGTTTTVKAGQLQVYQFVNPQGLSIVGGSIYHTTDSSGPAVQSNPGEDGAGQTLMGFLEGSNVDPVKELVTLIKTQRAFELNSQSIQSADQALQTIGNLRRA
jgi:flagellar basal-body rod protein FlgG